MPKNKQQTRIKLEMPTNKLFGLFEINKDLDGILDKLSKNYQQNKENSIFEKTNLRKHLGIYYTHPFIAEKIVKDTLSEYSDKDLTKLTFYEPCVGLGIFIIKYLDYIFVQRKINTAYIQQVVDSIFFSDVDEEAVKIFIKILPLYIKQKYDRLITVNPKNYFIGNVLFNVGKIVTKNDPLKRFGIESGFDVVITNPPYRLLKASSNKYDTKDENSSIINFIKKNKIYKFNEGSLNLYKIFVEEILENYTNNKGRIGLLIPNSILNDLQSEKLRKRIFEFETSSFHIIPEKNSYFPEITQGFCFFSINKARTSKGYLSLVPNIIRNDDIKSSPIKIEIKALELISDSLPVIIENELGWQILKKIQNEAKLKTLHVLKNLRGELDLTINKKYITNSRTPLRLLRGTNIKEYDYLEGDNYVQEEFLTMLNSKQKYVKIERLACQQISNIHAKKRLKFAKIKPNYILGNSCNFIAIETNLFKDDIIDIDYLLVLFNSFLLDWRFKLTSSNNHINNYELADLPIHKPTKEEVKKIKFLRKNSRIALENYILEMYGLNKSEIYYILNKYKNYPYA